jgi:hypothetical protein
MTSCILLIQAVFLNAQSTGFTNQLLNDLPNIPYVFEGQITNVEVYLGDKEGNRLPWGVDILADGSPAQSFSSATIEVCKIYKGAGELQNGTIEIVTQGLWKAYYIQDENGTSIKYYESQGSGHNNRFSLSPKNIGGKLIFFAKKSEHIRNSGAICSNNFQIDLYKDGYYIHYNPGWFNMMVRHRTQGYIIDPLAKDGYAYGLGQDFKDDNTILQYMQSLGLDINKTNYCTNWNDSINSMPEFHFDKTSDDIDYTIRKHNYDLWMERANQLSSQVEYREINSSGLILEMVNPRLTGTPSEYYLEFDVMASATDNVTWFDRCLLRIQYSAGAFGTNVAANNNITVTRGAAFNNVTYDEPNFYLADDTTTVVSIPFGTDFDAGSWNRTQLTISPIHLMTIRFTIQNCSQLSDLFFTDQVIASYLSYCTVNASDSYFDAIPYDNTSYNGTINDPMCEPIIDFGFTDNVSGGTYNTMTITGRYFGTSKFDGNVIFKDADHGDIYPPPTANNSGGLDHYDILNWSDNQIELRLPGRIDSIQFVSTDSFYQAVPGTGNFKVKNYTQTYKESPYPVTVPFSITQAVSIGPFIKRKIAITGPDIAGGGNQGYVMHCTPDVESTYPGAKAAIAKAMRDWSCASRINITLGADINALPGEDNTSLITLGVIPGTPVMYTDINDDVCNSGVPNFYLRSVDILIDFENWNTDTLGDILSTEIDFYEAFAHELGHAHLLNHINDINGSIMYYTSSPVFVPQNLRKKVWTSVTAMQGSIWVVNNLNLDVTTCLPFHVLYTPGDCTGIFVEEEGTNEHYVSLWPNPVGEDGYINIGFNLDNESTSQFFIYDQLGKLIRMTEAEFTVGKVQYQLPVANLAAGSYFVLVRVNDKNYAVRFIKTF